MQTDFETLDDLIKGLFDVNLSFRSLEYLGETLPKVDSTKAREVLEKELESAVYMEELTTVLNWIDSTNLVNPNI